VGNGRELLGTVAAIESGLPFAQAARLLVKFRYGTV
jgi:hypothetical protein